MYMFSFANILYQKAKVNSQKKISVFQSLRFSDSKKCYICRRIIKSNFKIVIYEKGNKIQFGLP